VITKGTTNGTYWYDFTNGKARTDRANGKYDRYCGSVYKLTDTPCTHLVVDGLRYLVFPQKQYCCMCCTAAKGCGIMRRDWVGAANGTFLGYEEVSGRKCEKWDAKGLQSNFYWVTADADQVPVKLEMVPNSLTNYKVESFKKGPIDSSVFNVPSYCSPTQKCPAISVCSLL
jgi:hypothetical protein